MVLIASLINVLKFCSQAHSKFNTTTAAKFDAKNFGGQRHFSKLSKRYCGSCNCSRKTRM